MWFYLSDLQLGAGNESRTRDLNLGKVALYQLSYSRVKLGVVLELQIYGAGNESRTRDLNLGKVALYQLSYSRLGCVIHYCPKEMRIIKLIIFPSSIFHKKLLFKIGKSDL